MNDLLISSLKTKDDIEKLEKEIELIYENIYKDDQYTNSLKNNIRSYVYEYLESEVGFSDRRNLEEYLKEVRRKLKLVEEVTLVLGFEPSYYAISKFYDLVQSGIKSKVILNILFDYRIIGGVVIIYKGMYKDYSLKSFFEAELLNTQNEIVKHLSSK